jgi:hypothetical protein
VSNVAIAPSTTYTLQVASGYKMMFYELDSSGDFAVYRDWREGVFNVTTSASGAFGYFRIGRVDDAEITPADISSASPTLELA